MNWQEYQDAVAELYEQLDGFGEVSRNVYIPDIVTGQPRQIDVLVTINERGHSLKLVVDAKFHEAKLDVKDIEEVLALSNAVGGAKAVIVAANGWSEPAQRKAEFSGVDLRILSLEEALDLLVSEKWSMCPVCERDCVVLDHDGAIEIEGIWLWWLAGQCRKCRCAFAWCQDCGEYVSVPIDEVRVCGCGHEWRAHQEGMSMRLEGRPPEIAI